MLALFSQLKKGGGAGRGEGQVPALQIGKDGRQEQQMSSGECPWWLETHTIT